MSNSIYEKYEQHAHRTFKEAAARYVEEIKDEVRALTRIEHSIASVMPYIGDRRLIDINDEVMKPFKHDRRHGLGHFDRPAMVGTINKDLTQVITILNRACRIWQWIPSTPQFVRVVGDARVPYPLTWKEQDLLFRQMPTGWDVCACVFCINTGLRKEELFGLRWADLVEIPELSAFVFVLNRTKNGEKRAVICNSIARRCVENMRGQSKEWVFPLHKMRCSNGKVWQQAWERAGLPVAKKVKRGIHNLRHTFGHRLRAAGVSQENRNALLGHARTNLAEHYALPDLKRLLEAAESITTRNDSVVLRGVWEDDSRPT